MQGASPDTVSPGAEPAVPAKEQSDRGPAGQPGGTGRINKGAVSAGPAATGRAYHDPSPAKNSGAYPGTGSRAGLRVDGLPGSQVR